MILEALLEQQIVQHLSEIESLSGTQFIASRSADKTEDADSVVAVAAGFRQHDSFSLSPVTVPVTLTIVTRVEDDAGQERHNAVVEAISDKLSYWHKVGNAMQDALTTASCIANELKMDGGSESTYDDMQHIWTDTINISIRGAEIFSGKPYYPDTVASYSDGSRIYLTSPSTTLSGVPKTVGSAQLTSVVLADNILQIDRSVFSNCAALAEVTLNDGLTSIGSSSFQSCNSLLRIDVPSSVVEVCGFYSCASLSSVNMAEGVKRLADYAFFNAKALQSIELPDSVASMGFAAFANSYTLERVSFGASMSSIGQYAFQRAGRDVSRQVLDFTRCQQVPTLYDAAVFSQTPDSKEIVVPAALYDEWIAADGWAELSSFIVSR